MTAPRSRKETLIYHKHLSKTDRSVCEFCNFTDRPAEVVEATDNFFVVKNIFPYSLWDSQKVADHLMIVPKQHIDSLASLNDKQLIEYVKLLTKYEASGYNIYSRAPGSNRKTVIHLHTHLIKLTGKNTKLIFSVRKPYLRITR